jgi:methyl-accepting chemotaxis protein
MARNSASRASTRGAAAGAAGAARELEGLRAQLAQYAQQNGAQQAQLADCEQQLAAQRKSRQALELEMNSLAARCTRLSSALDYVSASVMMVDAEQRVTYLNRSMQALFEGLAAELRRERPDFDPRQLLGSGIDFLIRHADPRLTLNDLSGAQPCSLKLAGLLLSINASAVFDAQGTRLGTVLEWLDRTQEVRLEEEVATVIAAAQAGDLRARVGAGEQRRFHGRLAAGINGLLDSTMQLVGDIKVAATAMRDGAGDISTGTANLSQRTEKTATSLEETASSMEQMTATVRQTADNAGQANQLAMAARQQAEKGGTVVGSAVQAMSAINGASKKIADIIGVIDEIAFQTNLLALNAAVEAARAGEQGRGFAVVATEVRNLAGRSATAAKEIKALIRDSVAKVEEGSKLVDQSGQTLAEIVSAVKKVTDIVAEIAAASREQSAGIEQVNKAVIQMDATTQQNAALVEQTTAASLGILEHAEALSALIARYQLNESARPATARPPMAQSAAARPPAVRPPATRPPAQSMPSAAERRTGERPWAQAGTKPPAPAPAQHGAVTPAAPAAAASAATPTVRKSASPNAGSDSEWQEF